MRDALGRIESVLLVGGTSEIGLAIVRVLCRERGASRVMLAGRDREGLQRAADDLRGRAAGLEVAIEVIDVTSGAAEHDAFVERVWRDFGDVDVAVFAVGALGDQATAERDTAHALDIVAATYTGAVAVLTPLARALEAQGHGRLVVLSSVAGERARRANYVYGSAKAGLDAFAQGLGDRLSTHGVGVLVVRPGFVHTRMTTGLDAAPLATTPGAVAREVVGGLDRGAHTVHVPPPLRWVMAVLRHLPRAVFRLLPR